MRARLHTLGLLITILLALILPTNTQAYTQQVLSNPDAQPPGNYVFLDHYNYDKDKYHLVGGTQIWQWFKIETAANTYDWTLVDNFIAAEAAKGKRAALRINPYDGECCGGSGVPSHLKKKYPSIVLTCSGTEIPRYWDATYKDNWSKLVKAFGARYNKDPRVAWIEISVGMFGETTPAEEKHDDCLQAAGLTSEMWVAHDKWSIDQYKSAFPNKQLFLQYAPRYLKRTEVKEAADYAASKGIGLKHNGLKPDEGGDAYITDPTLNIYQSGQYDPLATWGDKVAIAFEGSEVDESMKGRANTMWGIYNGLDKKADFLSLGYALVSQTDRNDLLDFAAKYLGKSTEDTPSVWTALRETEYDWFPDYGNYEFYLYQNDAVSGGKTVPLFAVGTAAEGRYTRRTDQATGNHSMYFDIDDAYVYGGSNKATVTVTYYDQGTDTFELRYDGTTGADLLAGRVKKGNTKTWKDAVFNITAARFANGMAGGGSRMGSDLRIYAAGDGDEIIHMVDVVATPDKPKTLILQPGVDGYNAMTDAYLTSWSVDKNTGAEDRMWVGYPDKMFGLLRFDLSSLPADAKVVTATLGAYQFGGSTSYAIPLTLAAHRLLRSWDEAGATWNKAASSVSWQQPGAMGANDREAAASGSVSVNQLTGWAKINITGLVQKWLDAPASNYGLLLKGTSDRNAQFYFYSSEASDVSLRPYLQIDYYEQVKPPSTWTPTVTPKPVTATPTRTPTTGPTPTNTPTRTPLAATATITPSPTATFAVRSLTSRNVAIAPVIDGSLSEWTQPELVSVKTGTAETIRFQANPTTSDLSADVRSFWDGGYLYFAASVSDEKIYADSPEVWNDDSVEFGIDAANDQLVGGGDDHQFTVTADGDLADFGAALSTEARAAFKLGVKQRAGGYDVELAIPASYLAASLSQGQVLGFTIGLNDDDDGGKRDSAVDNHMVWEGSSTNSAPQDFGKLSLGALYGVAATATPTGSPTPSGTPSITPSATPTATPSITPSLTSTATPSSTPTITPTPTITQTPTETLTPTPSLTPSQTPTAPPTVTRTVTPTATPGAEIGGRVWLDRNGNGALDAGEDDGIGGIKLTLALVTGSGASAVEEPVMTATTGPLGRFLFSRVAVGRYTLALVDAPGFLPTTPRKLIIELQDNSARLHDLTFGMKSTLSGKLYLPYILRAAP